MTIKYHSLETLSASENLCIAALSGTKSAYLQKDISIFALYA